MPIRNLHKICDLMLLTTLNINKYTKTTIFENYLDGLAMKK